MRDERRVDDQSLMDTELARQSEERNPSQKSVGICFSTGGYRTSFHAGFVDGLKTLGVEVDQYLGASSGALSAFLASLGVPGREWHDEVMPFWHLTMLKPKQVEASIISAVSKLLNLRRESDAPVKKIRYELLNRKLRIIAATLPNLKPKVFSSFDDKEDVIKKIIASSAIPYWTKFPSRKFDGFRYINGFFSTILPYELPTRFLATDIKISLRIVPPYFDLNIPNIRLREFSPKKYRYNIIQSVVPLTWMMSEMYQDGYQQALHSGIDKEAAERGYEEKGSDEPAGENEASKQTDDDQPAAGSDDHGQSEAAPLAVGAIRRWMKLGKNKSQPA